LCPECFTAEDFSKFRGIEKEIRETISKKDSERSKICVPRWIDIQDRLHKIIETTRSRPHQIIAILCLHGYTLRPDAICNTHIGKIENDKDNVFAKSIIDLDTGRWVIPKQKSFGADFYLSKECLSDIKTV
jgi:hypothetical protein